MFRKTAIIVGGVAALMFTNAGAYAQNYSNRGYCEDYARQASYREGNSNAVVGGVVTGAVLGGVVGAITGQSHASNIATGAAVGGVTGGVLGSAGSNGRYDQRAYDQAYWNCMNRSQYRTQNRRLRFSANVNWCASRYHSYNPSTGLYMSSSGQYRHCP